MKRESRFQDAYARSDFRGLNLSPLPQCTGYWAIGVTAAIFGSGLTIGASAAVDTLLQRAPVQEEYTPAFEQVRCESALPQVDSVYYL